MTEQVGAVLELAEQLVELLEPVAVVKAIERAAGRLFGGSAVLVLKPPFQVENGILLQDSMGQTVGCIHSAQWQAEPEVVRAFVKLSAWALSRVLPSPGPVWSDLLRVAKLVVEEGLPKGDLCYGAWHISGALQPAYHVGGDCYSYLSNDDIVCFLLLDAVGHGVGSALLAASCRSLWRGVVYEKDLSLAIQRLNQRVFQDSGTESFVAATMGYAYPDGNVEFVCCGQSPAFYFRNGLVEVLCECDPPLGLFDDWNFEIQRLRMDDGSGLLLLTDGVLEYKTEARGMFGEQRVLEALARPLEGPEQAIKLLLGSLSDFAGGTPPPDDVCCLCLWRNS
ncbi:MAG: PP2C family protein-serine/threonine phosphatase [Vulcanimicrobiota bacterium]